MNVDDPTHPPEQGSQAGGVGTIPHEPTSPYDGDETDDGYDTDYGGDDNRGGGNGGIFVDSDSEDEFESDEEDVGGQRDMLRVGQRSLEFELRAAEAGNVLYPNVCLS